MNFKLDQKPCRCQNIKHAIEKDGHQQKIATIIQVSTSLPFEKLEMLGEDLPKVLYAIEPIEDNDGDLAEIDYVYKKRLPASKPISLPQRFECYSLEIPIGITGTQTINLNDVRLSDFTIDPQERGFTALTFKITANVFESDLGRVISILLMPSFDLTLTPPPPELQAELELKRQREALRNDPTV
jgi:hypothetical protein